MTVYCTRKAALTVVVVGPIQSLVAVVRWFERLPQLRGAAYKTIEIRTHTCTRIHIFVYLICKYVNIHIYIYIFGFMYVDAYEQLSKRSRLQSKKRWVRAGKERSYLSPQGPVRATRGVDP